MTSPPAPHPALSSDGCLRPSDCAEALALRAAWPEATVVAGGTLVMARPNRPDLLLDLSAAGLDVIATTPGGWLLGATLPIAALVDWPVPGHGAVRAAVQAFGPAAIARMATLGGNILFPNGTLRSALHLLGAVARVQSVRGTRRVALTGLVLQPDELLIGVELPRPVRDLRSSGVVLRRTPAGPSLVVVAVSTKGDSQATAVVAAGGPLQAFSAAAADLAAAVSAGLKTQDDLRGSADYRRAMATELVHRALRRTGVEPGRATSPAFRGFAPLSRGVAAEWACNLDGTERTARDPGTGSLAEALRDLGALQVKIACAEGTCGACSVLVDGVHVHSCLYPAHRADRRTICTAATFADGPVARALGEHGGLQCGFCTPGFVVAVHALVLRADVAATPASLRTALDGNLCRCTGYGQLLEGAAVGLAELRAQLPAVLQEGLKAAARGAP